jgi:hypothetical protein
MKLRTLFAAGMAVLLAMLLWALPAQAAETIYWSNFNSKSIAFANLDGTGGGNFDTAGQPANGSEGLAIDSASGRLFWASYGSGSSFTPALAVATGGG